MKKLQTRPASKVGGLRNNAGRKTFSAVEIRKLVDPGPPEEAEKFVQLIYEERRQDRQRTLSQ